MRKEFIAVETIEQAEAVCPWAAKTVEVEGGFYVFESISDYEIWLSQV